MPRILASVPKREWSPSQRSNIYGPDNVTRFRLRAMLDDGHLIWTGWFDDRDDLDAFLCAIALGSIGLERGLWRLPQPAWHPDLFDWEDVTLEFVTISPRVVPQAPPVAVPGSGPRIVRVRPRPHRIEPLGIASDEAFGAPRVVPFTRSRAIRDEEFLRLKRAA